MKMDRKAILFEMADKARRKYYEESDADAYEDPVILASKDELDEIETPDYGDPMIVNQEEDPIVISNNEFDEEDELDYIPVDEEDEFDDETYYEEDDDEFMPVDEEDELYYEEDDLECSTNESDEDDMYFENEDQYGNPVEDYDEDDVEYKNAVAANNAEVSVESKHFIKSVNKNLANCRESYRVYRVNSVRRTNRGLVAECITKNLKNNRFKKSSVLVQGYKKFYRVNESKSKRRSLSRRGRKLSEAVNLGALREFTKEDYYSYPSTDIVCADGTTQKPLIWGVSSGDIVKTVILGGLDRDGSCTLSLMFFDDSVGNNVEYAAELKNKTSYDIEAAVKVANKVVSKYKSVNDPEAFRKLAKSFKCTEIMDDFKARG